jgi:hypothetical protein
MAAVIVTPVFRKVSEALPLPSRGTQGGWLVGVLMVATALLAFRSIDDLDYGIHVGTGRWILQNGRVPSTDPFTWSIPEHVYIAYHWGFQVIVAGLYERLGHLGPVLLRFALVLLTAAALVGSVVARKVDVVLAGVCGLLALVAAEVRFAVRPELFTYLFLALLMLTLDLWRNSSRRVLLLLPLIFIGWVNTHIYILGFVILGAHVIEQVYRRTVDKGFLVISLLAAAALLVNPYGLDAVMEPLRLFTRMSKDNIFAQHITELASPLALDDNPRRYGLTVHFGAWASLLVLAVPAIVGLYRSRRVADLIVLTLFAGLSLVAVRNITLFVVVAVPLIGSGLTLLLSSRSEGLESVRRVAWNMTVAMGLLLCVRVSTGAWYAHQRRPVHMAAVVERSTLALEAAQFVERMDLKGRGFNNFNVGGALILGAPSHPIYIDGRNEVTGERFFRDYLEILKPNNFEKFLQSFRIEYVVLGHSNMMHLVNYLLSSNSWTVVYYDSVGVVFVRKEGPNGHLPPASLPLPMRGEQERWAYLKRIEIRPSVVDSFSRWLLGGEELPLEKEQIGAFLLRAGRWAEAERPLLEAAVEAPNFWETLNNLGSLYMRLKDWEVTSLVYRGVLMLNPSDPLARERLGMSWDRFKREAVEKQT